MSITSCLASHGAKLFEVVIFERLRVFCEVDDKLELFAIDCQGWVVGTVLRVTIAFVLGITVVVEPLHSHGDTLLGIRLQVSPAKEHNNGIDSDLIHLRS